MNTEIIYPLIVPSSYYEGKTWNLPHQRFPFSDYILTWVFFRSERTMSYMNQDEFVLLNSNYPNWQQIAFNNLRLSGDHFYTRFRRDENTDSLSFIIFTNEDGMLLRYVSPRTGEKNVSIEYVVRGDTHHSRKNLPLELLPCSVIYSMNE